MYYSEEDKLEIGDRVVSVTGVLPSGTEGVIKFIKYYEQYEHGVDYAVLILDDGDEREEYLMNIWKI